MTLLLTTLGALVFGLACYMEGLNGDSRNWSNDLIAIIGFIGIIAGWFWGRVERAS